MRFLLIPSRDAEGAKPLQNPYLLPFEGEARLTNNIKER